MDNKERIRNHIFKNFNILQNPHLQVGGAVVTRSGQANRGDQLQNGTENRTPVIFSKKRKLQDVIAVSKKKKSDEPLPPVQRVESPLPGSSRDVQEDGLMDYDGEDTAETGLFDTVTPVYEDGNLEVNVVKEMFRRQKVFRIEDHSYVMRIRLKNKQSEYPLLNSLFDVLYKAFTFMINNLKTFLPPIDEEDNLVYLCINQDGMTNSLNSGSFRLQSVETEDLVQSVLNMFEQYVNSDSTLNVLDNSFKCYFRVLSIPHVKVSKHRRKAVPQPERIPSRLGCRLGRSFYITDNSGLFDIPGKNYNSNLFLNVVIVLMFLSLIINSKYFLADGFPKEPSCFKNKCLLTSFVFGYYQYQKFDPSISDNVKKDEKNLTTYDRLSKLNDRAKHGKEKQNSAGKELKTILTEMCENLNIPLEGPHKFQEVLTDLSNHFKCQIHLLSGAEESRASYESFPKSFDNSLPQIFLFKISDQHVVHIRDLKKFFESNRLICFYCRQTFYHRTVHKCPLTSCKQCSLPVASSLTKQLKYLPFKYCDKMIKENTNQKCLKCLQIFQTELCLKTHLVKCEWKKKKSNYSKLGQICQKCFKFISFKKYGKSEKKSPEEILKLHKCFEPDRRLCKHCREYVTTSETQSHSCKVRKKDLTKIWPNLVFFHFEYRNISSFNCEKCKAVKLSYLKSHNLTEIELEQHKILPELVCDYHTTSLQKDLIPNVAVIWREKERGVFEEYVLSDEILESSEKNPCDIFKFEYYTNENIQPFVTSSAGRFNKEPRQTVSFINNLSTKLAVKKRTIIYKFLELVTQSTWKNSTLISWNENVSHLSSILEALISVGAIAKSFHRKRKLYSVQLEKHNLKFIDACNFFSGNLHDVASQFEVNFEKTFFPNWNRSSFYAYNGPFPPLSEFLHIYDSTSVQRDKKEFCEKNCHIQNWCFKTEIVKYAKQQTEILAKSCLHFLKQTFVLQERIKKLEKMDSSLVLHPFSKEINSRSSFTFNIHKAFYLNKYDLESVMFEKTSNMKKVSYGEYQYVSFKALTEPDAGWRHAFNSKFGQKRFGNYHVDLFSEKLNVAINFGGCLYHFHEPCTANINKNRTPTTKNFLGKTCLEQQEADEKFIAFMSQNFPSVRLEFMNACDWNTKKRVKEKNKKTMWYNFKRKYRDVYWDKRPLKKLIPREAVRGGALEVYNLMFDKSENLNEDVFFTDINNLYSEVAQKTRFGIGPLNIIIDPVEIKQVYYNITDNQFYYKDIELQGGAAFCTVLVPENEEYPFLPYRIKNESTVMACCRTCSEKKLTKLCCHKKESRAFTGCWMISTLNQLAKEGYQITFLEVHYFSKKAFILKDYVQLLCSERLKNSGVINDSMTTDEKQLVCDEINLEMELPEPLKLRPTECFNNPGKKNCFKNYMNCLFGMYSRNTSDVESKACNSQADINKIAASFQILNVNLLSDNECKIDYLLNSNSIPPNRDCNIYIGGEIASQAFVRLRKHLRTVLKNGGIPLMIDTDSILFKIPKNKEIPLKIGSAVGLWKHEYSPGSIEKFFALASRNYTVSFKDQNNVLQQVLKVRGLCLKMSLNQNSINCDTYKDFISNYLKENLKAIQVPQTKRFTDSKTFQYRYKLSTFNFCNNLTSKRFLLTNNVEEKYKESILKQNPDMFKTYPYGYKLKNEKK